MAGAETERRLDIQRLARRAVGWAVAFLLLLTVLLLVVSVQGSGVHLARLDTGLVLAVLGLSLANYAVRGLRWQWLCRLAGLRIPFAHNSLYYVAGFAFGLTPGKVGEVVRLWLLRRYHGVPYKRSAGLMLMDRLTDAVPIFFLCLPGMVLFGQAWAMLGMAFFVLGALILVLRPVWLRALLKLVYGRVRRRPRLFAQALGSLRSLQALASPWALLAACCVGLLGWSAEILGAWLVLHRLGAEISLLAVSSIFAFSMLVGSVPILPGGLGGAEGAMIALLILLGVDAGTAVAATAITRLATLGFAVLLGFIALPLAAGRGRSLLLERWAPA